MTDSPVRCPIADEAARVADINPLISRSSLQPGGAPDTLHLFADHEEEIKVTPIPDWKTVYVEQFNGIGRAIIMTKYKVDGKPFWAGYSPRSQKVYVSRA